MNARSYTPKQMGDACEMLVAAEVALAGSPTVIMPDNWPGYDIIAQPKDGAAPQRISVKSRTFKHGSDAFVDYDAKDQFDWLAIVLLPGAGQPQRRVFIVPKAIADTRAFRPKSKFPDEMYWRHDKVAKILSEFENNYCLSATGAPIGAAYPEGVPGAPAPRG